MADQSFTSNGFTTVWLVPANGIADYRCPTADEINMGMDITPAIAWDGTTFPAATDSDDVEDRSLRDKGNATTRGAASYEAVLNLFYPRDLQDTTSEFGKVYQMLRNPRVPVFLVTRVAQSPEGEHKPAEAGEWISVFRFISDGWTDDFTGDESNKYSIGLLTQGEVAVYTQVKNSTPVEVENVSAGDTLQVGEHAVLRATLGGKRATQVVEWKSSDPGIASVSQNGVVTAVSTGTADITATHPAADGASTAIEITVS